MKRIIIFVLMFVLALSTATISFAVVDESKPELKVKVVKINKEIKEKDLLLERAKKNINDDKGSKFEFNMKDGGLNAEVINTYQTSQLLKESIVNGIKTSDYAATSIVELATPTTYSHGSGTYTGGGHVYVYNTIYYTLSEMLDKNNTLWPCATFSRATGTFTRYDGVATSNHKIVLYEGGVRLPDLAMVGLPKPYSLGTALSYDKTTGFPAMTNLTGTFDAPVYSIKTTMNWSRGGSSGISNCTYTWILGTSAGDWS